MDYTFLYNHVYAVTHTHTHTHTAGYVISTFPQNFLHGHYSLLNQRRRCNAQEAQQHMKVPIFSLYIWFFSCHAFLSGCSGL